MRRGKMAVVTEIDIINELKMNNILNKLEGNLEVIALELGEIKQIIKEKVIWAIKVIIPYGTLTGTTGRGH